VVTTHLIFFGFFTGAEPTAAGGGFGTSHPPIGYLAFNDGATPSDVEPEPEPTPSAATGGGRMPRRRRYLLPDGTLIWATLGEIQELLESFIEAEAPKAKKAPRKALKKPEAPFKPEVWEPIRFEPLPDVEIETYRVLVDIKLTRRKKQQLAQAALDLKRRIDDEEAILLLL
jgi:hypothetical protein